MGTAPWLLEDLHGPLDHGKPGIEPLLRLVRCGNVGQPRDLEWAQANGKESGMPQRREAAIVGIYEYPLRVDPHVSAMQIKAECAARALADAGLAWHDV